MSRVVMAKVIFRDACDPDIPGDCAPVVSIEGAAEVEELVSEFGIAFEEALQEQVEALEDELEEDEEVPEAELELDQFPSDQPTCPLEPELDWDDSVCGEIERQILSRVLGG